MRLRPGINGDSVNYSQRFASSLLTVLDSHYFVPVCFVIFLALRTALVFSIPIEINSSDAGWFLQRGLSIARGEGYAEGGYPTAYWPVGYPGFLGVLFYLFGQDQLVGQIANLLMAAATFFLQLELTRRIFNSEPAARLGVLLLTIYPNHVGYTAFTLTEIYFTFLLLLGIYIYLVRGGWMWVVASGIIFGLATLTKPQVIFLPGLLVLLQQLNREKKSNVRNDIVKGFVIYLMMAAVLVPWAVRNSHVFGQTVLISTNGGATLLTGNNPSADGSYIENDPLVAQRNFSVRDQVEADRRAKELALNWIKENPARFVQLVPLKIWHLWAKDGEIEWGYQSEYPHYDEHSHIFRSVRWINQIFYALLVAGSLGAAVLLIKNGRGVTWPWVLIGYCLILYLTLISMVFSGQSRFHFPAMPWIIMYASWAAVTFLRSERQRRYEELTASEATHSSSR
jgi:4-amino-4-deoxy-L-arabinose transferase-like glycosyltransferase